MANKHLTFLDNIHLSHNKCALFFSVLTPAIIFFFNWDSLHARLNSYYEARSYKNKTTKKITGYRKSV